MTYDPTAFVHPSLLNLDPFPAGDDPFHHDLVQMGTPLVRGWFAMHHGYDSKDRPSALPHIDLINTRSGQRIRVQLNETPAEDNSDVFVEVASYLKYLGDKLRQSPVSDAQEVTDHLAKLDRWAHAVQSKTEFYIQHRRGYVVHGSTGCSCCRSSNFIYTASDLTLSDAVRIADDFVKSKRVSSQYSSTGIYWVYELDYEILPDGRVIAQGQVFQSYNDLDWEVDGIKSDSFVTGLKQVYKTGKTS